ncbi:MAG: glycosyltransferase family 39 protein [Chloroflexi bacterium]|nr:glycosyltransferase family 39 protein [Chloroflexota bacterium]
MEQQPRPTPPTPFPTREGEALPLRNGEEAKGGGSSLLTAAPWIVLALALVVRAVAAAGLSFPALDDPAFYLTVAANLAQGRGLVIDAIWSYHVPFAAVTHPSNEYWTPLTSLALAPALALFGPSYRVAQALWVIIGVGLVGLTFAVVRASPQVGKDARWLAPAAGLLVALNPLLVYQTATVDSTTMFSLIAGLTLLLLARCPAAGPGTWAAVGVGLGLSYLTRNHGALLLPVALIFLWLTRPSPQPSPRGRGGRPPASVLSPRLLALLLPWGLLVGAWLARNALTFGSPFPFPMPTVALIPDYPSLFWYPAPSVRELLAAADPVAHAWLRVQALAHTSVGVLGWALLALAPFSLAGLWLLRRDPVFLAAGMAGAVLVLGNALVFPVPSLTGAFFHSAGVLVPFLTVAGLVALKQGTDRVQRALGWQRTILPVLLGGVLALTLAQLVVSQATAWAQHRVWARQFGEATRWLREHDPAAVVITTQPYSLHYASGLPAVVLPSAQPPTAALEVARRYGARYLVLTERFGRYPDALQEAPPGAFRLAYRAQGLEIYEVAP